MRSKVISNQYANTHGIIVTCGGENEFSFFVGFIFICDARNSENKWRKMHLKSQCTVCGQMNHKKLNPELKHQTSY